MGDESTSKYHVPKNFRWYRGPDTTTEDNNIVFFTDLCLNLVDLKCYRDTFKVAMLIEPFVINPQPYQYILQNHGKFDLVLSHHSDLSRSIPNMEFYPNGMSWVDKKNFGLHVKSKNISIIASNKNSTNGHKLRHGLISHLGPSLLDIYGSAYNPIDHKIEALKDYCFSVAIENTQVPHYFTEKLLDCFLTGTIPIYWGCPEISKFFNPDGFVECHSPDDLLGAVDVANSFKNKNPYGYITSDKIGKARKENFELAKQYIVAEDWIFENILQAKGLV